MARKLRTCDFEVLAASMREMLELHEVPEDRRASLLADLLFGVAAFLDERTGSNHHEGMFELTDALLDGGQQGGQAAAAGCEAEIVFGKGRKVELNLLPGHRDNPAHLRFDLEIALGLRAISEIDADIDADARFQALLERRQGIRELRFLGTDEAGREAWTMAAPPSARPDLDALARGLLDGWSSASRS